MQNRPLPYNSIGLRQQPHGYQGYQGYGGQNAAPKPVQSVAEILSEPLGDIPPDLRGATGSASRQREIANMLMQGAQSQQATDLATGFSKLGQAWLARKANQKADAADSKRDEIINMLTQKAAAGDEASIAQLLSPEAMIGRKDQQGRLAIEDARYVDERDYGRGRDALGDTRYEDETGYLRGRDALADSRYVDERDYGRVRDQVGDTQWEREFNAAEAARKATASSAGRYGVTPVFGRDANGNRVILQTNNAGGVDMAALPEGITLEDDYSRTYSRETAKNDAKIAAYETTAGRALSAFETKADELMGQIDTAIEQTNGWNTGVLGQFIAGGDLDGTLDAIGAKAMLSELVAIKDQGGTLGALSDSEGKALRDAAVNVARSQSEKQLDANLKAYRLQVERAKMVLKQAFEDQYVNGAQAPRGGAPAATGARVGPSGQPPPPGFE